MPTNVTTLCQAWREDDIRRCKYIQPVVERVDKEQDCNALGVDIVLRQGVLLSNTTMSYVIVIWYPLSLLFFFSVQTSDRLCPDRA